MTFFKHPCTVRRYGQKVWKNGLYHATYTDLTLSLDVQNRTHRNRDDSSGQSEEGNLTIYSDVELYAANPTAQQDADRLLYIGRWYECISCTYWGNTIMKHWQGEFKLLEGEMVDATE